MSQSPWVVEVNQGNFSKEVVQRSFETPVLVDFWAPWCGPCRTLGPALEKLADEMQGRFVLAKINSDENPNLAKTFDVRGIPTVKLVAEGRVLDQFTGALSEGQIRQFLDKSIPSEADKLARQGMMAEEMGDINSAFGLYQSALAAKPDHDLSLLGMARILVAVGRNDEARPLLEKISREMAEDPEVKALKAKIAFGGGNGDLDDLRARVIADPGDLEARLALGNALVAEGEVEEGMEQFLELVRRDRTFQEEAGRKALLQTFDMLGLDNPVVLRYRRRLSSMLFS